MHSSTAEQMHMNVPDRLPSTFAAIEHRAKSARDDTFVLSNLIPQQGHLANQFRLVRTQIRQPFNMLSRNYQNVRRSLRTNVSKGHELLVLVNLS